MSTRWPPGRLAAAGLPFALIMITAFNGGGYDALVRGQLGFAVWWLVLLGGLLALIRLQGVGTPARIVVGLLAGLAAWTAATALWSESPGDSVNEAARAVSYLGILVVGLAVSGAAERRVIIGSIATAIAVVGVASVFSRLHPQWFELSAQIDFLSEGEERLSYPLGYWNGVATLIALGLPLLIHFGTEARSRWLQAASVGVVPALALAAFLTFSRGGVIAIAIGLVALLALHPRRLRLLPTLLLAAIFSALLIGAGDARSAFAEGNVEPEGLRQANQMLALTVLTCLAAAAGRFGLARVEESGRMPASQVSRRTAARAAGAIGAIALVIAIAAGGPGFAGDQWDEFKSVGTGTGGSDRLTSSSGNGRYQWWSAAVDAGESEPIAGIGAGTFDAWWVQTRPIDGFVRDAHSLYLESFGELGLIGLVLVLALIGSILAIGFVRTLNAATESRKLLAAAFAGLLVFAAAAAADWVWEQPVLVIVFLLLAAPLLTGSRRTPPAPDRRIRAAIVAAAVLALIVISVPLLGEHFVQKSRADAQAGQLDAALDGARRAVEIQPYSAEARLQEALVLELRGELAEAAEAAEAATDQTPNDWQAWLVRARIEWARGNVEKLERSLERARELNPRSPLFN